MKFTFKTEKPTGRFKIFSSTSHFIKLKKKEVGHIVNKSWEIRLAVVKDDINEDGNPNCKWRWVTLEKKSTTLQEAKDWLNTNFIFINEKYKIFRLD